MAAYVEAKAQRPRKEYGEGQFHFENVRTRTSARSRRLQPSPSTPHTVLPRQCTRTQFGNQQAQLMLKVLCQCHALGRGFLSSRPRTCLRKVETRSAIALAMTTLHRQPRGMACNGYAFC